MTRLIATLVVSLLLGLSGCECGVETSPGSDAGSGGGQDAMALDDAGVDGGVVDSAGGDRADLDAAVDPDAASDAAVVDALLPDAAAGADAGATIEVTVEIKVDELGTSDVHDVRFNFVRVDWAAFQPPVACAEDGGYADAGADAGSWSPFADYSTESVGETVVLNGVSRTVQSFAVTLPERPPEGQLAAPPDDPCNFTTDLKLAYYLPMAYLDSSAGVVGAFDPEDDVVGMGEIVRYASDSADGQPYLVYAEGSGMPFGEPGWNYLVLGIDDAAPAPEVRDLNVDTFPVSITVTPRATLEVSGSLLHPDDVAVTPDASRRAGLVMLRTLGGLDEIVSAPATGITYGLSLPAELGGGDISDLIFSYGPLSLARGMVYVYGDADTSGGLSLGDPGEGSSDQSCPAREVWFFQRALPWPLVIYTRAKLARGYNVLGMGWDEKDLQVSPFVNVPSRVAPIDIDIPPDPNHSFTDNQEPIPDRGCACGVIPSPYRQGCN